MSVKLSEKVNKGNEWEDSIRKEIKSSDYIVAIWTEVANGVSARRAAELSAKTEKFFSIKVDNIFAPTIEGDFYSMKISTNKGEPNLDEINRLVDWVIEASGD